MRILKDLITFSARQVLLIIMNTLRLFYRNKEKKSFNPTFSAIVITPQAGVDPGIFCRGGKLEKVFMHILRKLGKSLENIGKNLEQNCPVGGGLRPLAPP